MTSWIPSFRPFYLTLLLGCVAALRLAPAADAGQGNLLIVEKAKTRAVVAVNPQAGPAEKKAADDLVLYVERMTGARPALAHSDEAIAAALKSDGPVLLVGELALKTEPSLRKALAKVAKKDPVLRADAIALLRKGNRVYLAGTNDDSHYYAAAELLHRWGCRWYLPTEFGECIPEKMNLAVGKLDYTYAPAFEVRSYWLAWNGSREGHSDFLLRNRMNHGVGVPNGHAIGKLVKELIPKGKRAFNVPIADDATADHIVAKIAPAFAQGKDISLGMEDGIYESDSPLDMKLRANLFDKYFQVPSLTDPFMVLYNKVCERLLKQHPESKAKIGFLAYSNITLPPQRRITAAKPLVAYLAGIDVDPIHGMDDPKSPPRQEYKEMLYRWAEVMQGRVVIYDYDQGMLVWRDVPAPSIQAIRQDVQHYRKAGILGVRTESRGASATVFLNLFVRGQLYWNPDADIDEMMAEFYEKFYGPAAKPMAAYWTAINDAWKNSIVTEHEHFIIPAIYTPALVEELRKHLEAGEKTVEALRTKAAPNRDDKLFLERMKFTRQVFDLLDAYTTMVRAATEGDYRTAVQAGERGLKARKELAAMNPTFTTHVLGRSAETEKSGAAWWPGEVQQYRDLQAFTDGTKGKLIAKTPLEWAFRRDPHDTGLASGWAYKPVDLTWWNAQKGKNAIVVHQNNPGHWESLRTDLYMQAQGVVSPDYHSYTGFAWYRTDLDLNADMAGGKVHLKFPGLFNECWLYVNGYLVEHRTQKPMWWRNNYKFEWDVDLTGQLKAGKNTLALRLHNPHHFGGIFRRPFLYQQVEK